MVWNHVDGSPHTVRLSSGLMTRAIRLHPQTYTDAPVIRLEILGCAVGEQPYNIF